MRTNAMSAIALCVCLFPALLVAMQKPQVGEVHAGGQTLFAIRTAVGSFTPAERAQAVSRRLEEILNSPLAGTGVSVQSSDVGMLILVGDKAVVSVTESDAKAENLSVQALANRWSSSIREGLLRALNTRVHKTWWIRLLITLAVLAATALAIALLRKGRTWLQGVVEARRERIQPFRFRGLELVSSRTLLQLLRQLVALIYYFALVLAVFAALLLVFEQFPRTQRYARQVFLWIWQPFVHIVWGVVDYLPNLFYILVIIVVIRLVIRALTYFREGRPGHHQPRTLVTP